jgi:enoyl-CoA hydratase/carnithine racemase
MTFRASAGFTQEWQHFDLQVDDGIATLTFTRPERLNALTFDVYADLRDLLTELPHRDDVRVLLITGTGRGFCSGGDVHEIIGELVEMETKELLDFTRMTGAVVQGLCDLPQPVISAINGVAAGAGAVIALASDLRLMADVASLRLLFTGVGLSGADMGVAYLLPRMVGLSRATSMLLLGEPVSAEEADRIGLAHEVVPLDQLADRGRQLARRLADGPTLAYAATKSLLHREQDMSRSAAIETEALVQALLMTSEDHAEFHRAFTEGRQPRWQGR